MTKKGVAKSVLLSEPYARRYFVLKDTYLFYYTSRDEYRTDVSAAIKSKPIDIEKYIVEHVVEGNNMFKILLQVN